MRARLVRIVNFALRYTSRSFRWHFLHYASAFSRGRWPKRLHLRNPKSLTEKIRYLRIHIDRLIPDIHLYADKLRVRDYVAKTVGECHLIPLLGTWDRAEDIVWSELPNRFAVKANHGAGFNILVRDATVLDTARAVATLNAWLDTDFAQATDLNQYRQIPRRLLAEELLGSDGEEMIEYKFWCFNGKCGFIVINIDRHADHRRMIVDTDWNPLPVEFTRPKRPKPSTAVPRPERLAQMLSIAESLAAPFAFVSADLYEIDGSIYFGEFEFTPWGGDIPLSPHEWDRRLGDRLHLPKRTEQMGARPRSIQRGE